MLNNLTRREKIVILVALFILFTGIYYFNYYQPLKMEKLVLEEELTNLQSDYVRTLKSIKENLPKMKETTIELEAEYQQIIQQFPDQKEISEFLVEIVEVADQLGIKLDYFSPKNMKKIEEFYALPINISFTTNYSAMINFLYAIEQSTRIIEIVSFDVDSDTDQKQILKISLSLIIYIMERG